MPQTVFMLSMDKLTELLSPEYIPPKIVAREKQLTILAEESPRLRNFFIEGLTNTGKTVTVTKAMEANQGREGHQCIYVKCERSFTFPFREAVERVIGKLTFRQKPIPELFKWCKENKKRYCHIYIDDSHLLAQYAERSLKWTEIIHVLYETAKTEGVRLQLVIVGTLPYISYSKFTSSLRADDRARGQFGPLIFNAYTPEEMNMLYSDRLRLVPLDFEPSAVNWVVATVTANAGELPMGFNLLQEGACEMLRKHATQLTEDHVRAGFQSVKVDYWQGQLEGMDYHSRLLLIAATTVAFNRPNRTNNPRDPIYVTGHDIGVEYERLCAHNKRSTLYAQRRTYLLMKLSMQGFLSRVGRDEGSFSIKYKYELNPITMMDTMRRLEILPTRT